MYYKETIVGLINPLSFEEAAEIMKDGEFDSLFYTNFLPEEQKLFSTSKKCGKGYRNNHLYFEMQMITCGGCYQGTKVRLFLYDELIKKRIRQVRDTLNKCRDEKRIEKCAEILGI